MRKFEIPYNFDKQLIYFMKELDPLGLTIHCIYLPPFFQDYQAIERNLLLKNILRNMTRQEYEEHIKFINSFFPGKIQILLQKKNQILDEKQIKYYINLGINKFCVGSFEQSQIIKNIDNKIEIVGSIAMRIQKEDIILHQEYNNIFNGFVLPFNFCRDLKTIKELPKNYFYILLINSYCNKKCDGHHHWNMNYDENKQLICPGRLGDKEVPATWEQSTRIRPMDLGLFDQYIYVYKLQDRGWPTDQIIRDYILYTTNYDIYPNISYTEDIYNG